MLMTAQLANGGFQENKPKIIVNKDDLTFEEIKSKMNENLEKKIQGPDFDDALLDLEINLKIMVIYSNLFLEIKKM